MLCILCVSCTTKCVLINKRKSENEEYSFYILHILSTCIKLCYEEIKLKFLIKEKKGEKKVRLLRKAFGNTLKTVTVQNFKYANFYLYYSKK